MFKKLLFALALTGCVLPNTPKCKTELPKMHYTEVVDGCNWGWTVNNHPKVSQLPCRYGADGVTSNACDRITMKFCSNGVRVSEYIGGLGQEDEKVYIYTTFRDPSGCYVYVVQEER